MVQQRKVIIGMQVTVAAALRGQESQILKLTKVDKIEYIVSKRRGRYLQLSLMVAEAPCGMEKRLDQIKNETKRI